MKSKKKTALIIILSVLLICIIGAIIYFFPLVRIILKGGNEIPREELDSATQDYMAILESMNAQTGVSDNNNNSNSNNSNNNDNSNTQSDENSSSADSSNKSDTENSSSDDNSAVSEKSDSTSSADKNSSENNVQDNNNIQPEEKPVQTNPPKKDYSQFLGSWKGYFGTEMEPTYDVFEDLGFELISCDGQDIDYTFWLTCSGYTKKLDKTYGRIDDNNHINIIINGESAGLTLDLVFEDDGSIWGIVSNAHILDNPVTFPVLFFKKQ